MWEVAIAPLLLQIWKVEPDLAEVDLQSVGQCEPTLPLAPGNKR
jgi:hypothetical protein